MIRKEKENQKLKRLIKEMKGKSEEEIINIMVREGVLKRDNDVVNEFEILQRRRNIIERFLIWIKNPLNNFPSKMENTLLKN